MFARISLCASVLTLTLASFCAPAAHAQNKVMGELQFTAASKIERNSGVWIDGEYVGYVKELKGDKKLMLLPGEHELSIRQAGYLNFTQTVVIEPKQVQVIPVAMQKNPRAFYPDTDAATLKLDVMPERAAVFVDESYVGHARDFGGLNSMLVTPGKHRVKVELPGYQTFDTEINSLPGQKTVVKTDLVPGSIEQAGALIKEP